MDKRLLNVSADIEKQEKQLAEINEALQELGIEKIHKGALSNNIEEAIRQIVDPEKIQDTKQSTILQKLPHYIHASMVISDAVKGEDGDISYFIKRQREVERASRKDRWILWLQQLVRWVIAILLAVFLYSGVVWMTEDHCTDNEGNKKFCVVVPVKDWLKSES